MNASDPIVSDHPAVRVADSGADERRATGEAGHRHLSQARADFAMAHIDRATASAKAAVRHFADAEGEPGDAEAEALCLLSRAQVRIGLGLDAVEKAMLAAHWSRHGASPTAEVRSRLALASALSFTHAFAQADREFEAAALLAGRHLDADAVAEVQIERGWHRAWRHAMSGWPSEPPRLLDADLRDRVADAWRRDAPPTPLAPVTWDDMLPTVLALEGLQSAWQGQWQDARRWQDMLGGLLDPRAPRAHLMALQSWLACEVARGSHDRDAAAMHANRLTAWAAESRHEPLTGLGHVLAADVYESIGRSDLALAEWRRKVTREQALQVRQVEGRGEAAGLQMLSRTRARTLSRVSTESEQFRQWAYEDPLTTLANKRGFAHRLAEWASSSRDDGRSLAVAIIDVDQFKRVNDRFGHEVGDKVLAEIGRQMRRHCRAGDLPARWGGDEFAVLFRDTSVDDALDVARRIQDAVDEVDWSATAEGLQVGISVGVVSATESDDKGSLIARADQAMYAEKARRRRRLIEPMVPSPIIRRVARWLRSAERVVLLVGQGQQMTEGTSSDRDLPIRSWSADERQRFGHASGLAADPEVFAEHWEAWRLARRDMLPSEAHLALVRLSRRLHQSSFVSERVDNLLMMAGAQDVLELYGNAFRWRCHACGSVRPNVDRGRCLACNAPAPSLRPDIVLLDEMPDPRLQAGAELLCKRAEVVLAIDTDLALQPTARLLQKARARGARVVLVGTRDPSWGASSDLCLDAAPALLLDALSDEIDDGSAIDPGEDALSDAGFASMCFLTDRGTDGDGHRLRDVLAWTDTALLMHQTSMPWLFPLDTPSSIDPSSPVPTAQDFVRMAADPEVRRNMRLSVERIMGLYGFECHEDRVTPGERWHEGFAIWAPVATHHDLFLSRILGSLRLLGMTGEARAWLSALETAVRTYRGEAAAATPLRYWRAAASA